MYKREIVSVLIFFNCLHPPNSKKLTIYILHKKLANLNFLTFGKLGTFYLFEATMKGQPCPLGVSLSHNGGNTIYTEGCMAR